MCIFREILCSPEFYTQKCFFIRRICYDFKIFNLLRNAVSFKQITNYMKLLETSLEIYCLQNKYACEVKTTELAKPEFLT